MKTLKINDRWRIVTNNDTSTLISVEEKIRKDGKSKGETFVFEKSYYYNSIASALQAYLLKALDESQEIKDILKIIEKTLKEVKSCIK